MVFSSLLFLFLYLPVVLLIYYICPRKFRNLFLFAVNLVFYGWGEPVFVLLMMINIVCDYTFGYFIGKHRQNEKLAKTLLVTSVIINLSLLGFFKYAGFLTSTLNILPFLDIPVLNIPLPIGISFYTFQTMSYIIDVYRGDTKVQKNLISFGTYVALFPQLIAGPIVRYKDVAYQIDHRRETFKQFNKGVKLFLVGLAKKVLIANQMGLLWGELKGEYATNGVIGSWVGIIAYSLQIYFDFSGYSDMACGLGNMLGFEFLKNFNYPYISKSITDFWRRWHISLGTWFREYVYIPLGGNRKGLGRLVFNLLIVWFLTGLWHGASYNFIIWGLYFGIILIVEKLFLLNFLKKLPAFVGHLYALVLIIFGWVIFDFTNLSQMGSFFKSMFDFSNGIFSPQSLSMTISYLPLILAGIIASTPVGARLYEKLKGRPWLWIPETAYACIVLLVATSSLMSQSYNPFLYFRF